MEDLKKIMEKRRNKIYTRHIPVPKSMEKKARGGRTWKQIAQDFCRNMLKLFRMNNTEHWVYPGTVMRELVGNPDNGTFRKYCLDYGIKIRKDSYTNAYNVQQVNPAERK